VGNEMNDNAKSCFCGKCNKMVKAKKNEFKIMSPATNEVTFEEIILTCTECGKRLLNPV
jgi:RNase P subunit RPR2